MLQQQVRDDQVIYRGLGLAARLSGSGRKEKNNFQELEVCYLLQPTIMFLFTLQIGK